MAKLCPILKLNECEESKCQLWVPMNEGNSTCALAAIPQLLAQDLQAIEGAMEVIARNMPTPR